MKNTKSLLRRLFELALLAGMAMGLVWVLSLGLNAPQKTAEPAAILAVESPYPPPATATPSLPTPTLDAPLAYPPPGNAPEPSATPDYCVGMGQWLTFTDPVAGYSISYPGEAIFIYSAAPKTDFSYLSFRINVSTNCYNVGCSGLNTIGVMVFPNPDLLELQPFIEQTFYLDELSESSILVTNYEETGYFTKTGDDQDIRAFRIENGVTPDGGVNVFIANVDRVILIAASRTSKGNMPPFDPPCVKTLEILDMMLSTLVLTVPSQ